MSVSLIVHDLQTIPQTSQNHGNNDGKTLMSPPNQIWISVSEDKSVMQDVSSRQEGDEWSCVLDDMQFKVDANQDVVLKCDFDDQVQLTGTVSHQDLLGGGFKNFIIPLYKDGGDEPVCQVMLSAYAENASVPLACLGELEAEAELAESELFSIWERYSVQEGDVARYLDEKSMTALVEDILSLTRKKWIHRFQASRVDRVFNFVHTRITPTQLAMIFVKQLDMQGDRKVRWVEFKERFHQSVRLFLKRVETDILNEPSKGEFSEEQHSQLEHFFERELRDSIQCLIL